MGEDDGEEGEGDDGGGGAAVVVDDDVDEDEHRLASTSPTLVLPTVSTLGRARKPSTLIGEHGSVSVDHMNCFFLSWVGLPQSCGCCYRRVVEWWACGVVCEWVGGVGVMRLLP